MPPQMYCRTSHTPTSCLSWEQIHRHMQVSPPACPVRIQDKPLNDHILQRIIRRMLQILLPVYVGYLSGYLLQIIQPSHLLYCHSPGRFMARYLPNSGSMCSYSSDLTSLFTSSKELLSIFLIYPFFLQLNFCSMANLILFILYLQAFH